MQQDLHHFVPFCISQQFRHSSVLSYIHPYNLSLLQNMDSILNWIHNYIYMYLNSKSNAKSNTKSPFFCTPPKIWPTGEMALGIFHFQDHFKQKYNFLIHWVLLESIAICYLGVFPQNVSFVKSNYFLVRFFETNQDKIR